MNQQVFRLSSRRSLERCSVDQIRDCGSAGPPLWIDLGDRDPNTLRLLLESIGAHPLAIEACLDLHPASLFAAYGKSLFLALPIHATWDSEHRTFLWIICLPRIIVTVHETQLPALEQIIEHYSDGMRFHGAHTSAILYQILDYVIDEDMAFSLKARDAVDRLEQLLDDDSVDELAEQTLPLKRQLTRLAAAFEDQLYCVSSLQTIDSESFTIAELRDYFRDAFLHLEHASRVIGRQQAHLNAIGQQHQLRLQDKANDRLRLLTIISTVFIPLTLITGIYGMNFRYMPELAWRYGYGATLLFMLAVAGSMLWQFHRRGWFQ